MRSIMKNEHQVRKDCFAFDEDKANRCKILDCLYCSFEECKFYRSVNNQKEISNE